MRCGGLTARADLSNSNLRLRRSQSSALAKSTYAGENRDANVGSGCAVRLPIAVTIPTGAETAAVDARSSPRPKRGPMAKLIFVVDDEKCIADTLAVILRKSGYEARAFYNAQSALEQVKSCGPELVISDVVMPGMSGVEMAVLIKELHPTCRVLLFSGQAGTVDILEKVRGQGYNFELLAKPIHPTDLLARVADIDVLNPK